MRNVFCAGLTPSSYEWCGICWVYPMWYLSCYAFDSRVFLHGCQYPLNVAPNANLSNSINIAISPSPLCQGLLSSGIDTTIMTRLSYNKDISMTFRCLQAFRLNHVSFIKWENLDEALKRFHIHACCLIRDIGPVDYIKVKYNGL
jgi:hypothetical protein